MDGSASGSGQAGANTAALQRHLRGRAAVLSFPVCEPPPAAEQLGGQQGAVDASLAAWLEASAPQFDRMVQLAGQAHQARMSQLQAAAGDARRMLWWPFTQHASVAGDAGVTVIDSRVGEHFSVYRPAEAAAVTSGGSGSGSSSAAEAGGSLELMYDACASWWTQGVSALATLPAPCQGAWEWSGRWVQPPALAQRTTCVLVEACKLPCASVTVSPAPIPCLAGEPGGAAGAGACCERCGGTLQPRHVP